MFMIIKNIGELVGIVPRGVLRKQGQEMSETGILHDAWLRIAPDGTIEDFGTMREAGAHSAPAGQEEVIDAEGGMVMPGFCDSHTHIVYAGSREGEFLDKIKGLSYEQIAARGGGILNSADLLNATSEDELFRQSMERVEEMMAAGTTAIEIKSGYGLCPEGELKMLRVIK
ncbi:MAG: amidohydrolase family protein, partial [Bacteroidales bacterium]|nr:amidohydrolase family protein [Bacteroidales bacterium]MBR0082488.1 amidohydrolase family protein [Bacteroidales bacterium]